MTKTYIVGVRELYLNYVTVQANNVDEAIKLARDRASESSELEYIAIDRDASLWSVNEVED